jgi:hypothetical protein
MLLQKNRGLRSINGIEAFSSRRLLGLLRSTRNSDSSVFRDRGVQLFAGLRLLRKTRLYCGMESFLRSEVTDSDPGLSGCAVDCYTTATLRFE